MDFPLNWVSIGNMQCFGRAFCQGDSDVSSLNVSGDAHWVCAPVEEDGSDIYLPPVVLRAISSSLQLHVEELHIFGDANLLHGRAVRRIEELPQDRISSFFGRAMQNDSPRTENESKNDSSGIRCLFRHVAEWRRREEEERWCQRRGDETGQNEL